MVFSSTVFLFLFFPLCFLIYYNPWVKNRTFKNIFLLLCSLFFYAWGESLFVFVMIFSIVLNFFLVLGFENLKYRKLLFIISLIFNLSLLFIFKYLSFFVSSISIRLPIGISFFTFQIISYCCDVYMGKVKVQKNPFDLALYISLFPQLIAGPIVRYETIADQIQNRKESKELISKGFYRFVIGLGKKVLLANKVAVIADNVFGIDVSLLSTSYAWLGAIAYSIQIYFDFSGYSDMAIGLGQIFGFTFEENFNYPYMAKSVTDFWRRWHISLSTWFKDYVYIPLGGNRCSKIRNYFNLFVVWAFTGIWHGANWTFWLWGIYYFLLLVIEKTLKLNELKSPIILFVYRIFTLLLIILGWVLFRSETILYALEFIKKLFMFETDFTAFIYTIKNGWLIIIISLICCFPVSKFFESTRYNNCFIYVKSFLILIVFSLCIFSVISSTYNPFIYFNF